MLTNAPQKVRIGLTALETVLVGKTIGECICPLFQRLGKTRRTERREAEQSPPQHDRARGQFPDLAGSGEQTPLQTKSTLVELGTLARRNEHTPPCFFKALYAKEHDYSYT